MRCCAGARRGVPLDSRTPSFTEVSMRVIGLVVLIGAVLLIGIVVVMGGFSWPESYELPDGLKGWVVIRYEIPSCPPMRNAGIFRIVVVDASGRGCTSESRSESYELPDGLKGWVVIRYEIPSCPPMRNAGIFRIVVVDASGSGCTSES